MKDVLDLLASGATPDEVLADPYLEPEDITAVLAFAARQNDHLSCGARRCASSSTRSCRRRWHVDSKTLEHGRARGGRGSGVGLR